jgi:hypothetical protein
MSLPQLFVVVSTGQNVANLPPVLERARPGDLVLWVESASATSDNRAAGARQVLRRAGLAEITAPVRVAEENDPAEVARACRAALEPWRRSAEIVLVVNGGRKLTPAGLIEGCRELAPTLLYGEGDRAELWVFEGGAGRPPRKQPYARHRLDLADVLEVSGHVLANPDEARRAWPTPQPFPDLEQEAYGRDAQATRKLHADHHAWASRGVGDDATPVHYGDLARLLPPPRLDKWRRALEPLAQSGQLDNPDVRKAIYNATLRLADDARMARHSEGLTPPARPLGPCLERAVLRRTARWAEAHGAPVVQSVWGHVKAARAANPADVVAEFDALLVLRNGILIHLECKSAAAERKDLDARLLNLQRAGSRLARMAVCVPVCTAFADEEWFQRLHELRRRVEADWGLPFVPLTLEGQPAEYQVTAPDGGRVACHCPTFEEALGRLLAPFAPSAGAAV